MLSLVQEKDKAEAPYTLVLFGGADGFFPLESFEPTRKGWKWAKSPAMRTGLSSLAFTKAAHSDEKSSRDRSTPLIEHQAAACLILGSVPRRGVGAGRRLPNPSPMKAGQVGTCAPVRMEDPTEV